MNLTVNSKVTVNSNIGLDTEYHAHFIDMLTVNAYS
jgi:hypothetical protein